MFFKKPSNVKKAPLGELVPPGQFVTEKLPVLTFGATPSIDLDTWEFKVSGLVQRDKTLIWDQFVNLPKTTIKAPFHCVTQWSNLANLWEGVQFREILNLINLRPEAKHVMVHCYGGYSTNLPIDTLMESDVLFAHKHNGEPLTQAHGGPVRLVVPSRYGWKNAKWVNGMEFMSIEQPGFWEKLGYHSNGDPWQEQRYQL